MKHYISIVILLLLSLNSKGSNDSIQVDLNQKKLIEHEISIRTLQGIQEELKNDKEDLKEIYSTSYQSINKIITIILSFITIVITILGVLGYGNLNKFRNKLDTEFSELKKSFSNEFKELKELKGELIKDIDSYKKEISEISKKNLIQEKRIDLIDLKANIYKEIRLQNYSEALRLCLSQLKENGDDTELRILEAKVYLKLLQYDESIKSYEKVLEIDPNSKSAILNLAEIYALAGEVKAFKKHNEKYSQELKNYENKKILDFFNVLRLFHENEIEAMIKLIKSSINDDKDKFSWNFIDVFVFINKIQDTKIQSILFKYIQFLHGIIDKFSANEEINTATNNV